MKVATPAELIGASTALTMLGWETNAVMSMRLLGMMGLWSVAPSENARMFSEKPPAFAKSAAAGMSAAVSGKRPDEVAMAMIKPLRAKTRSNSARLAKKGPSFPKLK